MNDIIDRNIFVRSSSSPLVPIQNYCKLSKAKLKKRIGTSIVSVSYTVNCKSTLILSELLSYLKMIGYTNPKTELNKIIIWYCYVHKFRGLDTSSGAYYDTKQNIERQNPFLLILNSNIQTKEMNNFYKENKVKMKLKYFAKHPHKFKNKCLDYLIRLNLLPKFEEYEDMLMNNIVIKLVDYRNHFVSRSKK